MIPDAVFLVSDDINDGAFTVSLSSVVFVVATGMLPACRRTARQVEEMASLASPSDKPNNKPLKQRWGTLTHTHTLLVASLTSLSSEGYRLMMSYGPLSSRGWGHRLLISHLLSILITNQLIHADWPFQRYWTGSHSGRHKQASNHKGQQTSSWGCIIHTWSHTVQYVSGNMIKLTYDPSRPNDEE